MKVLKVRNIIAYLEKVRENAEKALEEVKEEVGAEKVNLKITRLKDNISELKTKSDWLIEVLNKANIEPEGMEF